MTKLNDDRKRWESKGATTRTIRNDGDITSLCQCLNRSINLDLIPKYIKKIIENESWKVRFSLLLEEEIRFERFEDFLRHSQPAGLGLKKEGDIERLRRYCQYDADAFDALTTALTGKRGGDRGNQYTGGKVNNVNLAKVPKGNSLGYTRQRLKRERPDLLDKVNNGELSANAAAIQAGFRKKPSALETAKRAIRKMTEQQFKEFKEWFESYER